MSQPDRRSLLIGACRQRQEQILSKLVQVRQRLQLSNGLDNQRWVKVENDLLTRHDLEEQRIQRLMTESQESSAPRFEVRLEEEAPARSLEPAPQSGPAEELQRQLKRAQTLLAQKTQLCLSLQDEVGRLQAQCAAPSSEVLELRAQNAALSAELDGQRQRTRQNDELASELAVMTESVVRWQEKNAALQAQLEQKDKEGQDLRLQMESLSADLLLKTLATERLQADIDLKGGQASRSQEELLLKVQGLEARLQQSSGLQARLEESEAQLLKLTQDHSAVTELAGQRALQIEQLQREIDQLFQEVSNTHQSVQQHYEEAQGFKSQLLAEQESSRQAIADLRHQLSQVSSAQSPASEAAAPPTESSAPETEAPPADAPAPEAAVPLEEAPGPEAAATPSEAPVPEAAATPPEVPAPEAAALPEEAPVLEVQSPLLETAPTTESPDSASPSPSEELDLEGIPELVLDEQDDFDFASVELDPPPDWLADEIEKPEFDFNSIEEENPPDWLVAEKPTE